MGHQHFIYNPITKATIGLDKVDNTSDADKPISVAVQAALDQKISGPAKQTVFDLNDSPRITIDSLEPVVILSAEIELFEPGKLEISGVINGSFYYVVGIACYIDGVAINQGTGTNHCHPDCYQISYIGGSNGHMRAEPFQTHSEELEPGLHTVQIAVAGVWNGTKRAFYINNRVNNDMASSSSLKVRAV